MDGFDVPDLQFGFTRPASYTFNFRISFQWPSKVGDAAT
jgi:hypothetical protein